MAPKIKILKSQLLPIFWAKIRNLMSKSFETLNFRTKNQDFDPKLKSRKKSILTNLLAKIRNLQLKRLEKVEFLYKN